MNSFFLTPLPPPPHHHHPFCFHYRYQVGGEGGYWNHLVCLSVQIVFASFRFFAWMLCCAPLTDTTSKLCMSGHYGEPASCVKPQCCILLSWPGSQLGVSSVKMSLLHSPRTSLLNLFGNQTMALVIHASAYKPGFCCSC